MEKLKKLKIQKKSKIGYNNSEPTNQTITPQNATFITPYWTSILKSLNFKVKTIKIQNWKRNCIATISTTERSPGMDTRAPLTPQRVPEVPRGHPWPWNLELALQKGRGSLAAPDHFFWFRTPGLLLQLSELRFRDRAWVGGVADKHNKTPPNSYPKEETMLGCCLMCFWCP